jgi:hypothetical protein
MAPLPTMPIFMVRSPRRLLWPPTLRARSGPGKPGAPQAVAMAVAMAVATVDELWS